MFSVYEGTGWRQDQIDACRRYRCYAAPFGVTAQMTRSTFAAVEVPPTLLMVLSAVTVNSAVGSVLSVWLRTCMIRSDFLMPVTTTGPATAPSTNRILTFGMLPVVLAGVCLAGIVQPVEPSSPRQSKATVPNRKKFMNMATRAFLS